MIGAEASERDANNREKAAYQEARLQQAAGFNGFYNFRPILFSPHPPPPPPAPPLPAPTPPPPSPPPVQLVPNTPAGNGQFGEKEADKEEEEEGEGEEEEKGEGEEEEEGEGGEEEEGEGGEEAFMPPPSTASAKLQLSRAGRKRAPTMKALESEEASNEAGAEQEGLEGAWGVGQEG